MLKKIIIKELDQILKKNTKFLSDIWLYGSIDDELSDLDLICVYKTKPKKIKFSKFLIKKIDDGTIIYIPNSNAQKIFLFEKLNIYSIKFKKKIFDKISKKNIPFRNLTSFLERYYERRSALLNIKFITPRNLRLIKSTIFSYKNFFSFCSYAKIKLKNKNFNFKEYESIRKKYLLKKNSKIFFSSYLKKFKIADNIFYNQSLEVLNNYFVFNKSKFLDYKFNDYTRFTYKKNKISIVVPKILAYIYKIYSSEKLMISKKIKKDFNSDIKKNLKYFSFNNYLKDKIKFLDIVFKDLKKQKFKKGLYRLNWYLN